MFTPLGMLKYCYFILCFFLIFFSRGITSIQGYSAFGREVLESNNVTEAKESFDVHNFDGGPKGNKEGKLFPDVELPGVSLFRN
jgi:hypothetical protein